MRRSCRLPREVDEDEAAWITEEQPEYRLRFKTLEWLQKLKELFS